MDDRSDGYGRGRRDGYGTPPGGKSGSGGGGSAGGGGAGGGGRNNGGGRGRRERGRYHYNNRSSTKDLSTQKKVSKIAQPPKPAPIQPIILAAKPPSLLPTTNTAAVPNPTPNTPVVIMVDKKPGRTTTTTALLAEPKSPRSTFSKVINEHWNFQTENATKMLTDNRSFLVVGVVGNQGVGKSTLLSLLYGRGEKGENIDTLPFPKQTRDNQLLSQHCTYGVDIAVSRERMILMDTQPLFSASCLLELFRSEPPLPNECLSYEHLHELQCLQLAVFIMSVCNVVLVVQDGSSIDWKLWHFLQTVTMLKTRFPDPSELGASGGSQASNAIIQRQRLRNQLDKIKSTLDPNDLYHPEREYYPDLVFVFNKSPGHLMSYRSCAALQHTLDAFFAHHPFKTTTFVQPDVLLTAERDDVTAEFPPQRTDDPDDDDEEEETRSGGDDVVPSATEGHLAVDTIPLSSSPYMSSNLLSSPTADTVYGDNDYRYDNPADAKTVTDDPDGDGSDGGYDPDVTPSATVATDDVEDTATTDDVDDLPTDDRYTEDTVDGDPDVDVDDYVTATPVPPVPTEDDTKSPYYGDYPGEEDDRDAPEDTDVETYGYDRPLGSDEEGGGGDVGEEEEGGDVRVRGGHRSDSRGVGTGTVQPSIGPETTTPTTSMEASHINFFTLPLNYDTHPHNRGLDMDLNLSESYQVASESFKDKILSLLSTNSGDHLQNRKPGPTSPRHTISKFSKPITEKEWLRNAGKLWEIIRRSPILFDYNKSVQSTNYKSSYYE